ncbi:MAG: hypothetical protein Q8R18_04590 [bacterium]|nr:hypothetical protein [bacterium]
MKIGQAYGFLQYRGKNRTIQRVFPSIVRRQNFSELAFISLSRIAAFQTEDSALTHIVEEAREGNMTHVVKATVENSGNREVALFVGDIFNGMYMNLFHQGDPFCAGIIYQRGDRYVYRRK